MSFCHYSPYKHKLSEWEEKNLRFYMYYCMYWLYQKALFFIRVNLVFLFPYLLNVATEITYHLVSLYFKHLTTTNFPVLMDWIAVRDNASGSGLIQDSGHFLLPWPSPVSDCVSGNAAPAQCIPLDYPFNSPSPKLLYILLDDASHWILWMTVRLQHGITGILLTKEFF